MSNDIISLPIIDSERQCQELIKLYVGLYNVKDMIVTNHCKGGRVEMGGGGREGKGK